MKITISPSEDQSCQQHPYHSVTIEQHSDDSFTAGQAVDMFYQAMIGFGFDKNQTVNAIQEFKL